MDSFDEEHELPPPPQALDIGDTRYASQLLAVVEEGGRAAPFTVAVENHGPGHQTRSWST